MTCIDGDGDIRCRCGVIRLRLTLWKWGVFEFFYSVSVLKLNFRVAKKEIAFYQNHRKYRTPVDPPRFGRADPKFRTVFGEERFTNKKFSCEFSDCDRDRIACLRGRGGARPTGRLNDKAPPYITFKDSSSIIYALKFFFF